MDELTFAVRGKQGQARQIEEELENSDIGDQQPLTQKQKENEVVTMLSLITNAAKEVLGTNVLETPRLQGMYVAACISSLCQSHLFRCRSISQVGGDHCARWRDD